MGVLPIIAEINIKKLTFLHHILTLDNDDPVLKTYQQQKTYIAEKNWANECQHLRKLYEIAIEDKEISLLSKEVWKNKVKERVTTNILKKLNEEKLKMKKVSNTGVYTNLKCQEYLTELKSDLARHLFRVRAKISFVKEHKNYEFAADNMQCRVCGCGPETLEHVLCKCSILHRPVVGAGDEYSSNIKILEMVAIRMMEFCENVDIIRV